ncbi:MAG: GMC family oxidoreductase [Flavobacteriales bacterium]|nr:GMC family oxidoreductase [Flavobacteriales bacterium]
MIFTSNEHHIIREVCDSFVGPADPQDEDVEYWSGKVSDVDLQLKIETSAGLLPPDDVKDLKKLLKILTKKELGLTWGGPLKVFSDLNQDQREKLFFRWSKSTVGDLRKAFNVFRKLSTFIYYSSAPDEIPHVHRKIGYVGPISSTSDSPTRIKTIALDKDSEISCEVLIIGSGAGGGLAAGMLAKAGKDVVLLEKGSFLNEEDFNEQEGEMISKLYDRGGALTTKDAGVTIFAGSCLGGGTTINWNASFRTPDYIRDEWEKEHGVTHINSKAFDESLDEVYKTFGINGDNSEHNQQNQRLWKGAEKRGLNPSLIERNVSNCTDRGVKNCGYCGLGCKSGCKQGTMRTSIQDASELGARIYCDTEVKKLITGVGKVTGAHAIHRVGGKEVKLKIKAEKVIVACGAIHTPALLMRSGIKHNELGKNLFFHPTVGIAAEYTDAIEPWFGPMMTTLVSSSIRNDGNYGYWIETPPIHPGIMGMTLPWTSRQQHKEDFSMAQNCAAFIVLTRDKYGGKVSVDKSGHAAIQYKMHSYDLNHSLMGMAEAAEIHLAAGAKEVLFPHRTRKSVNSDMSTDQRAKVYKGMTAWRWRPNDYILYSAHQMSTCRMGDDAKKHPVRLDGSFRGYSNLFIADGSALPSCPGINPMVSIMALTHYTIKSIIDG